MKSLVVTDQAREYLAPILRPFDSPEGSIAVSVGTNSSGPFDGKVVEGGIETQTRQVLENLEAVLRAGGSSGRCFENYSLF
ncbi:MAG: hypothetical protein U0V70_21315 [Terriglobia bacterium]